jgi:hypothetical protein
MYNQEQEREDDYSQLAVEQEVEHKMFLAKVEYQNNKLKDGLSDLIKEFCEERQKTMDEFVFNHKKRDFFKDAYEISMKALCNAFDIKRCI